MSEPKGIREEFERAYNSLKENKGPCTKCHKVHKPQPYPFGASAEEKKKNWAPQWHDPKDGHAYYWLDIEEDKFELALWAARWMAERIADDGSITKQQREWILKSAKELGDSQ